MADATPLASGQQVIQPIENPVLPRGHIRILKGNLAPDGAVATKNSFCARRNCAMSRCWGSSAASSAALSVRTPLRKRCVFAGEGVDGFKGRRVPIEDSLAAEAGWVGFEDVFEFIVGPSVEKGLNTWRYELAPAPDGGSAPPPAAEGWF